MSQRLISRSHDLKRLQDERYEIEVKNGYAAVGAIPYVNGNCEIRFGTLVSSLTLAGDATTTPDTHVIYFAGEHPCKRDGTIITGIQHQSLNETLADWIFVNHSFSNKPNEGYPSYYEKFKRYIEIIMAPAFSFDPALSAKTYKIVQSDDESVFQYQDTNASRSNITGISLKLMNQKIAIIGLGGTGSYVLDLIAKTPVSEIHLFDGDVLLQHNAFRSPGAPSIEELAKKALKTEYHASIYQKMHKHVIPHPTFLSDENLGSLQDINFAFYLY
jgi:hypothetical protein